MGIRETPLCTDLDLRVPTPRRSTADGAGMGHQAVATIAVPRRTRRADAGAARDDGTLVAVGAIVATVVMVLMLGWTLVSKLEVPTLF